MEPAESIFEKVQSARKPDPTLLGDAEELWRFSQHTYKQLERILADMREPILVERGLAEALKMLVSSRLPGVEPIIRGEMRLSADGELVLYRICQEAVSNIRKHAHLPKDCTDKVSILLELSPEQSRLVVQDYGDGFSTDIINDRKRGMGLQAMRNWARKINAAIQIRSEIGQGTYLEVNVPVINKENNS
jgi:signal transduction histidine kinase